MGISDLERVYAIDELASGDVMFAATGVTDGFLLRGVRFTRTRRARPARSSCARARAPSATMCDPPPLPRATRSTTAAATLGAAAPVLAALPSAARVC